MNKAKFITLDNGLTVLIYTDKSKMTNHVELRTFLGGANLKYKDKNGNIKPINQGTAHLLEHYVCECSNEGNIIDKLYAYKVLNVNAVTNLTETKYYFNTVYNFKKCLETLLTAVYNIEFTRDKLDKTKFAILNEIRDIKDNTRAKIYEANSKINYGKKIDIGGTKTSITKVNHKSLEEIYKTFYVPKNQFLVVTGNFEEEEILTMIKEFYKKYKFKNNKRHYEEEITNETYNKELTIKGNIVDEVVLKYKIKVEHLSNFEKYKLDWYLMYFLTNNVSKFSKLNEELKKQNIITNNISYGVYNTNKYKIISISAYTNQKSKFIKKINHTLNNQQDSKEDLELSKKDSILEISVRSDNISSFVQPIVDNYIWFGYKENDTIEFVDSLNYEEYKEIINSINFSKYSTLTIKGDK